MAGQDKKALRKSYKQKRLALSAASFKTKEKQLQDHLVTFLTSFQTIHLFLPIERLREFNTFPLLQHPALTDKTWCTSVVQGEALVHTTIHPASTFESDDWGIPTPTKIQPIATSAIDVVLVPLLAVDFDGNRIGYGKGYYDGFLKDLNRKTTVFCGVSFFPPVDQAIAHETHDVTLHCCATPQGILTFTAHE